MSEVKLTQQEQDELNAEVLESLKDYLPKLYSGLEYIQEKCHNNQVEQVDAALIDALEGIKWVIDVMVVLHPEAINYGQVNEVLTNLLDAMENNDKGTLGDVIEYELLDMVKEWQGKVCE